MTHPRGSVSERIDIVAAREVLAAAEYSGEWAVGVAAGVPYVETTQLAKAGREAGVRYGLNVWETGLDHASDEERAFAHAEARLIARAVNSLPAALDEIERLRGLLGEALDQLDANTSIEWRREQRERIRLAATPGSKP